MAQTPGTGPTTETLIITDPNNVTEAYANGPINISVVGPCAIITFCNVRPNISNVGNNGQAKFDEAVVAARIVVPAQTLGAIRGIIDQMMPRSGGTTIPPVLRNGGNGTGHTGH